MLWNFCFFSVQPLSWLWYKIHFASHVIIWLRSDSLLRRIREGDTSERQFFFKFSVSSRGSYLASLFTFPVCLTCQTTMEWLTLSSLATSRVLLRGSASMMLWVCHCQFLMASLYAHLQGSCLLCRTSHTFISSSWMKCDDVASWLLLSNLFWTQIRLIEFAFCLASFPWSKINVK